MQTTWVRCEPQELKRILNCICAKLASDVTLLCREDSNVVDVYAASVEAAELVLRLPEEPVAVGIHVARLRGCRIVPLLGLLEVIIHERRCGYVVASSEGERRFLYGRDLLPQSVLEYSKPKCGDIVVVYSESGVPIGWGKLRLTSGEKPLIHNLLDRGWYLRSGV